MKLYNNLFIGLSILSSVLIGFVLFEYVPILDFCIHNRKFSGYADQIFRTYLFLCACILIIFFSLIATNKNAQRNRIYPFLLVFSIIALSFVCFGISFYEFRAQLNDYNLYKENVAEISAYELQVKRYYLIQLITKFILSCIVCTLSIIQFIGTFFVLKNKTGVSDSSYDDTENNITIKRYLLNSFLLLIPLIISIAFCIYFFSSAATYNQYLKDSIQASEGLVEYWELHFTQNLNYGTLSLVSAILLLVYFIQMTVHSLPVFQPLIANLHTKWEAFKAFRKLPKEEQERIKKERKKAKLQKELDELED